MRCDSGNAARRAERAPGRCRASGACSAVRAPVDRFLIHDGRICLPPRRAGRCVHNTMRETGTEPVNLFPGRSIMFLQAVGRRTEERSWSRAGWITPNGPFKDTSGALGRAAKKKRPRRPLCFGVVSSVLNGFAACFARTPNPRVRRPQAAPRRGRSGPRRRRMLPGRTPGDGPGRGCRGRRGRSPRCRVVMRSWETPWRAAGPVQNTMREAGANP